MDIVKIFPTASIFRCIGEYLIQEQLQNVAGFSANVV